MNTRWQRGEITTFIVLGILALIGVATFLNTSLNQKPKTVNTNAQSCNFDSGQAVAFGQTETNTNNMENRWPISVHPHEYDFFSHFSPATLADAQASKAAGSWTIPILNQNDYTSLNVDQPTGPLDSKVAGLMGKMFGYKPNMLTDAYFMKYNDTGRQGADTLVKGLAPALKVPITPGDPVVMPDTGYDLGGGKEAMVVFAAADRITLHLSRAEYIRGSGANNCNGGPCSGGYWIYIRGICVDKQIQDAYNAKRGLQEAAGANKTPIDLPIIDPGRILGKAASNAVEVVVRDDGPLISIHKPFYWQGAPPKDFGTPPTATPVLVASATPTVPVGGATATPTPPSGSTCGYQGLRCCNPSDAGVPPGTSCFNGLSCNSISNTCLPASTQCGTQGNICCSSTMPGYTGVTCQSGLTCNPISNTCLPSSTQCGTLGNTCCSSTSPSWTGSPCSTGLTCSPNNICIVGTTPTATLTPTPQGTWTPTPTPNAPTPLRQLCSRQAIPGKYNLVFLPNNYTDYNKFLSDVGDAQSRLQDLIDPTMYSKFNFIIFNDINRSYNVVQCDPASGKKQPCWNTSIAKASMRSCKGTGYAIIQDTPKPEENPTLAQTILDYWGQNIGSMVSLGGGEALILRSKIADINKVLEGSITSVLNNATVQDWINALKNYL